MVKLSKTWIRQFRARMAVREGVPVRRVQYICTAICCGAHHAFAFFKPLPKQPLTAFVRTEFKGFHHQQWHSFFWKMVPYKIVDPYPDFRRDGTIYGKISAHRPLKYDATVRRVAYAIFVSKGVLPGKVTRRVRSSSGRAKGSPGTKIQASKAASKGKGKDGSGVASRRVGRSGS